MRLSRPQQPLTSQHHTHHQTLHPLPNLDNFASIPHRMANNTTNQNIAYSRLISSFSIFDLKMTPRLSCFIGGSEELYNLIPPLLCKNMKNSGDKRSIPDCTVDLGPP